MGKSKNKQLLKISKRVNQKMRVKNVKNKTPVRKNLKAKRQTPRVQQISPAKKGRIRRMISQWNSVRNKIK